MIKTTIVLFTILILSGGTARANTCLSARIEVTNQPRIELFADLVSNDRRIACNVRGSLHRLISVANDQKMRHKVWKRMLRQELKFTERATLTHLEKLADACNMSLR
jgi:hypothetical protein